MATAISSRVVTRLLLLLLVFPNLSRADGKDQSLPAEVPDQAPLLTGDAAHDRVVLTAGEQTDDAAAGQPHVVAVEDGTSSRRARKMASDALGLQRLPQQNQQLVQDIVDDVSIFRQLPTFRCEVDPRVHDYFVYHPDVAVSIWRAMGISQLQLWQTGDWSFGMDTKDGTTGTINVLYRSRESCLIVCNGMFKSPYLQNPIAASSVMHLRTSFSTDSDGRTFATYHADMFVSFPSQKVETVAKLISPVSNIIIDRNFQEISLFIHVMWLAMGRQPGWLEQIAGNLDGVPEERRDELIRLTAQVYVETQRMMKRMAGEIITLDSIRPPVQQEGTQRDAPQPVAAEQAATGAPDARR